MKKGLPGQEDQLWVGTHVLAVTAAINSELQTLHSSALTSYLGGVDDKT